MSTRLHSSRVWHSFTFYSYENTEQMLWVYAACWILLQRHVCQHWWQSCKKWRQTNVCWCFLFSFCLSRSRNFIQHRTLLTFDVSVATFWCLPSVCLFHPSFYRLPSNKLCLSCYVCVEIKTEDYQNCSVQLCCVQDCPIFTWNHILPSPTNQSIL